MFSENASFMIFQCSDVESVHGYHRNIFPGVVPNADLIKTDVPAVPEQPAFAVKGVARRSFHVTDLRYIGDRGTLRPEIGADRKSQVCHGVNDAAHHMPHGIQVAAVQFQ